jgi:hypothetical protein
MIIATRIKPDGAALTRRTLAGAAMNRAAWWSRPRRRGLGIETGSGPLEVTSSLQTSLLPVLAPIVIGDDRLAPRVSRESTEASDRPAVRAHDPLLRA